MRLTRIPVAAIAAVALCILVPAVAGAIPITQHEKVKVEREVDKGRAGPR